MAQCLENIKTMEKVGTSQAALKLKVVREQLQILARSKPGGMTN